ncbi:Dedicator of cytokinesis protein 9 [Halocaridina rubra]|uniref:Dedicator of cytokinesis protein 9 n=1 Tax=Halocaridina rubra TaxID=373956 RepID=A0AAN9A980_HALRR
MTRELTTFRWHCWSATAHPPGSSTTCVASQLPTPLLPLPQGYLCKMQPRGNSRCPSELRHNRSLASLTTILLSFRALLTPSIHPNLGLLLAFLPSTLAFITFFSNSLTPALEPVKPFPNPPTHEPTLEVQDFSACHIDDIQPYVGYRNHLYIYPHYLNYDNQKSFSRARNLVCTVELRDSDIEGAPPLKVVYGRPGNGVLTTHASTVVMHHNTFPEWGDEVKIILPHNLTKYHHLLFTFSHVAIEAAKAGKKDVPVETVVGYAWVPLTSKGRIVTEEQMLPVAVNLPSKYLSIEPLGLGKGWNYTCAPPIDWDPPFLKYAFNNLTVHSTNAFPPLISILHDSHLSMVLYLLSLLSLSKCISSFVISLSFSSPKIGSLHSLPTTTISASLSSSLCSSYLK